VKRISKRVRDEAIWSCDVLADASIRDDIDQHEPAMAILDSSEPCYWVVVSAWARCFDATGAAYSPDVYLEAAALLRDGWNPGDPVEVRK
jgi:hypothetical protein